MEKILAIYDSDVIYATRFLEYFKKKKDFDFEVSAFTRKDSFEDFLQLHRIEILILGEGIIREELPKENIKFIYQLTDDPNMVKDILQPTVFKYQPAQQVMTEIIADYVRKGNETQVNYNSSMTEIISVFAPIPDATKLSFAWSISALLSERKKILFVPLDLYPIQLLSSVDNTSHSLSEFIYYLKENPKIILKMKSLLGYSGNLAYLSGLTHGFDLLSLNKEDICKWIEEIKVHTDYQTVVFYLGCYNESIIELMKNSNSVLIATTGSSYEKAIQKEWERQMDKIEFGTNQAKFQRILLHEEDVLGQGAISLQELQRGSAWFDALQYVND